MHLDRPLDLRLTLGPLMRGPGDPCLRLRGQEALRATRTPDGPSALFVRVIAAGSHVQAEAWGPGADYALDELAGLVGAADDDSPLAEMLVRPDAPARRLLLDLRVRLKGLRMTKTGAVTEALVPTILEQKVPGVQAHRSYRDLVRRLGEPAPGPRDLVGQLMVPPAPEVLAQTPDWVFHACGVEHRRAAVVRVACSYAKRLDALTELPPEQAQELMTTLPGVGAWTAAEVGCLALGDVDAVSLGDYHLPHVVAWAFTGSRRGDDVTMLHLLEPYRGQRARVIRLIEAGGVIPPRRGPRISLPSIREM